MADRPQIDELLPAGRNFSQTLAERVRAQEGVPAYIRRKRQIEDWLDAALAALAAHEDPSEHGLRSLASVLDLARVNDLIDRHNRYYPIEANLPIDLRSGELLERGQRWRPMASITVESLLALFAAR